MFMQNFHPAVRATEPGRAPLALGLGLLLTAHAAWAATEAATETYAGVAITIRGNAGVDPLMTCFSVPIVQPVAAAGTITACSANTLQDTNAHWTSNQFGGTNGSFYVEFNTGHMADILSCDAAASRLTLPSSLPAAITVGSPYRIRRHQTLAGIFGARNEAGLKGGLNLNESDVVRLLLTEPKGALDFFYLNAPRYQGWVQGYDPAGDQVIYPEQGLAVVRKSAASITFGIAGVVKEDPTLAEIAPGYSLVGSVSAFGPRRLADLDLYTGDPATGLASGRNPTEADTIELVGTTTPGAYFYLNVPGYEGWYDWAYRPAGNTLLPVGCALLVNRKSPRGLFFWNIPLD